MGINVSIVAGHDPSASSISASGSVQHIITDAERNLFGLADKQLKAAVKAYYGKEPNDVFLHSPTPWSDLYKTYKWQQVQLVMAAQSAEVLDITSEPVIVKSQEFENNSSRPATFTVGISESVTNTSTSSWSKGGSISIGEKVSYGISIKGFEGKGETSLSYTQTWGVGGTESRSVTVGSTSGVTIELQPGEGIIAELSASRGVMKARIWYIAYLTGCTALNYYPPYKGHHFYCFPIQKVMAAKKITNAISSTEDIEIGYYSNSKIELRDMLTRELRATYLLAELQEQ